MVQRRGCMKLLLGPRMDELVFFHTEKKSTFDCNIKTTRGYLLILWFIRLCCWHVQIKKIVWRTDPDDIHGSFVLEFLNVCFFIGLDTYLFNNHWIYLQCQVGVKGSMAVQRYTVKAHDINVPIIITSDTFW